MLERIRDICYNDDEDTFTLSQWESLSVPELRTVVALIDDGGADIISASLASPNTRSRKGNCFLLVSLVRWIRENPTNPRTRRPITPRQREIIEAAYKRLVKRVTTPRRTIKHWDPRRETWVGMTL